MIYVATCYVEYIHLLQRIIDETEGKKPHLKEVKPRFTYDENVIGTRPGRPGKPLRDPRIFIEWDDGRSDEEEPL